MKPRSILLALACSIFIGNTSCIDNNKKTDNKAVQTAFEKQYPKVSDIDWKLKDSFYVVEFKQIGIKEAEAWYDKEGKWLQSEFDIKFNKLPQIVQEAFGKTKYATWKIDDIKILERLNMDNLCIIEVENKANNAEMTLFYTDSGLLIKEEPELDNQYITPFIIPDSISVFIQDKFPNAKIVETERVYDNLEID
ncbi:MAG: PepSY-like domain-containing protein, partial [Tannerellaceae bacterium]